MGNALPVARPAIQVTCNALRYGRNLHLTIHTVPLRERGHDLLAPRGIMVIEILEQQPDHPATTLAQAGAQGIAPDLCLTPACPQHVARHRHGFPFEVAAANRVHNRIHPYPHARPGVARGRPAGVKHGDQHLRTACRKLLCQAGHPEVRVHTRRGNCAINHCPKLLASHWTGNGPPPVPVTRGVPPMAATPLQRLPATVRRTQSHPECVLGWREQRAAATLGFPPPMQWHHGWPGTLKWPWVAAARPRLWIDRYCSRRFRCRKNRHSLLEGSRTPTEFCR